MNIEEIRDYCLSKKGTSEELPFDDVTLVFKVMGKIYALLKLTGNLAINLKCDPQRALLLREQYEGIKPGYHMNKQHWNTVNIDENIKPDFIKELIDHSYHLVADKLSQRLKKELRQL